MKVNASVIMIIIAIIILTGCPAPISEDILNQAKDRIAPVITISSPAAESTCGDMVEVRGFVSDMTTEKGDPGSVAQFSFEVPGTTVRNSASVEGDGSFSLTFRTTTLPNFFTLNIKAVDANGNSTTEPLPLHRIEGNGIPSFKAEPDNKKITLS